ncbi:glycerate kinase type-2 family protein [Ruixingdingia sedimenti]|uniref:DUF4147 domain-containing protein n=1 Tax=Ruixingdingia sedimenti TaxID=3073604 RepID=A0ABU1FCE1_9RHOB|nr:DUF4147 domain-containing protein [Xinfangfangia sp. LG-4]MDR5654531.1 DUF4147 domain-containing protein [Xinfangfangia sp. LG-4]
MQADPHPTPERTAARAIFAAGLAAADPGGAVTAALADVPAPAGRRLIVAIGKAGVTMAAAARATLGPCEALVVTDDANARPLPGAEVLAAGHPLPDARGAAAAQRVLAAAAMLGEGDQLLALVSGGGSALLPAPVAGVSLADKIAVNRLLLASGADIAEMNLIRQALSRIKGGGLARAAAPAQVVALILSDVMGDDPQLVASGPTAAPVGDAAAARAALAARGLWPQLPPAVRAHLETAPPPPAPPVTENRIIGSNALSVAAMARAAAAYGLPVHTATLTGDVQDAAARIAATGPGPGIWLWGGETTVRLSRQGEGGRNQELALRVALAGGAGRWAFLSAGTDGRDGPTDAAGGLVDAGTLPRIRAAGHDPAGLAADHDSRIALAAAGDLLITGGTGTNVADLQVLVRGPLT